MKSFKSTWILFGIVVAVVGLAVYQNEKDKRDDKAKTEKTVLLTDADQDLVEVRILSKDREVILKKDGKDWKLVKPVEDLADESAAGSFAESFGAQKIQATEKSGPAVDWKQYGFEEGGTKQVDLKSANGKEHHFTVSGRNAFDGRFYIRQGEKLLLGETSWASLLSRDPNTLRDKRLLRDPAAVTAFAVRSGKHDWKLTKTDDKWQGPESAKLDPEKIRNYVGEWAMGIADGVVESKDKGVKQAEILVLQGDKATKFTFFARKAEAKTVAGLPGPHSEYFVEASDRPVIYRMNKNVFEKLTAVEDNLRDRKWPFRFTLEQVSEVDVKTPEYGVKVKKVGSDWQLVSEDPNTELDKNRLPTFFEKIKNMEADEFVPAKDAKGLKPEKNKITMKDSAGQEIFSFVWGDEFSKTKDGIPMYYAKSSLAKEYLGVKTGQVKAIPTLITVKAVKPEGEKK